MRLADLRREMRSDHEYELQRRLRDKLTKQIHQELMQSLPIEIEQKIRDEMSEQMVGELKENNEKAI